MAVGVAAVFDVSVADFDAAFGKCRANMMAVKRPAGPPPQTTASACSMISALSFSFSTRRGVLLPDDKPLILFTVVGGEVAEEEDEETAALLLML